MMKHLDLHGPLFMDQVEPRGRLLLNKACHACWFYYMLADKNRVKVGSGIEDQTITFDSGEQEPDWMNKRYHQIAQTVAMIYGLNSPEDFLPYFPVVEAEAQRLGYTVHWELLRPFGVGRRQ